jgi:hypothetical protein
MTCRSGTLGEDDRADAPVQGDITPPCTGTNSSPVQTFGTDVR